MGKRGPQPKSPEVERAQGYPRKRKGETDRALAAAARLDAADAAPGSSAAHAVPPPPSWLGKRARKIWRDLVGDLVRRLSIKSTDHIQIARYCEYLAMWVALLDKLRDPRTGDITASYESTGASGVTMVRIHPDYRIAESLERSLRNIEREYGLTTASRIQLASRLRDIRDDDQPAPLDTTGRVIQRPGSPVGILKPTPPPHGQPPKPN